MSDPERIHSAGSRLDSPVFPGERSTLAAPRRALLVGTAWLALGVILSRFVSLGVMLLTARILGQAIFGRLCMVQQSVMLVSIVASYGFTVTASKHLAEFRALDPVRSGTILSVTLGAGMLFAGLSGLGVGLLTSLLPTRIVDESLALNPMGPMIVWLMAASLSLTIQGCLAGLSAFRQTTYAQFTEAVASCLCVPLGAVWLGLPGAVYGFVAASVLGCGVAGWLIVLRARECGIELRIPSLSCAWPEARVLAQYGLPVFLAGLAGALGNWLCPVLLVQQPDGFRELAILNAASYWFNALILLPNLLQRVGTVLHSAALGKKNAVAGRLIYHDSIGFNVALIGTVAVPLGLLSPYIMGMFGSEFRAGWPTMVVCLATALCLSVVKPAEQTLFSTGRTWTVCALSVLFAAGFVALSAWWVSSGAWGVAWARLVIYVSHAVLMSYAASLAHAVTSQSTGSEAPPVKLAA